MSNKMALDALTAALDAMEHMANTLNNMDAVDEDEDAQHDAAFEAVRAAIAALQAEPQPESPQLDTIENLGQLILFAAKQPGTVVQIPPELAARIQAQIDARTAPQILEIRRREMRAWTHMANIVVGHPRVVTQHSGCGRGSQIDQVSVSLNRNDTVVQFSELPATPPKD